MRILVTGASGFLGWHLLQYFLRHSGADEIFGCYGRITPRLYDLRLDQCDLTGEKETRHLVGLLSPTHVVHTAAMSQTIECERQPQLARLSNVIAPKNLVRACSLLQDRPYLLGISTDLVFDGSRGDYTEDDKPNPLQVYGCTKLEGETELRRYPGTWAILRSTLIYGPETPHRRCFLQWMLENMRERTGVFFDDEFRNPVWVQDLCKAIVTMCHGSISGLFHCGGGERLSRWQFAKVLSELYHLPIDDHLCSRRALHGSVATRPADVSLNTSRLKITTGFSPTPLREALMKC